MTGATETPARDCGPPALTDADGRTVQFRRYGEGPVDDEFERLVGMYTGGQGDIRTLGLPPRTEAETRAWLADVLKAANVVAWHGAAAVGHGILVPEADGRAELAVFVDGAYQRAGVGTRLVRTLSDIGRRRGVATVWLYVDPLNQGAVDFYRSLGFETVGTAGNALEMERPL